MRQEVQVYETIKLKGLNQRFEESDEGDRQMGSLFIVVIRPFLTRNFFQEILGLEGSQKISLENFVRCTI